jgi:bifunctional non-homologous end joining protein LigD
LIKREDEYAQDLEADDLIGAPPKAAKAPAANKKATGAGKKTAAAVIKRSRSSTWKTRALAIEGARDRGYPAGFAPQLASTRAVAPAGDDWLHEIKWDGYRMMADLVDGAVKLRSRGKLDWTGKFPEVVQAIKALPVADLRLDGELVVLDKQGRSDFSALQRALDGTSKQPLRYIVFDMPGIAGVELSGTPLVDRKSLLKELLGE